MAAASVQAQLDTQLTQLTQEGLLDEQFMQLLQLQDETNPNFVSEVMDLYFEDTGAKVEKIGIRLAEPQVDFNEIDQLVHQFKGSSASFGARRMADMCVLMREACHEGNASACQGNLQQIAQQFQILKSKLQAFMQLEQQRKLLAGIT